MHSESRGRDEEHGQMMLLAAIVLLIAFLSMAVMVARVTLVANETSLDQHGAFLREAEAVARTITMIDEATNDNTLIGSQIADLQAFEAQRGYLLSWDCNASPADDVFRFTDGRSTAEIELPGASVCT